MEGKVTCQVLHAPVPAGEAFACLIPGCALPSEAACGSSCNLKLLPNYRD